MNTDTYIFGYTDADGRDEIVLCALCGSEFFKANPNEWAVLRTEHAIKYPGGRECDKCCAQVYFPHLSDVMTPSRIKKSDKPICIMSDGQTYELHRLKVFQEYLETLEF
jgi:hypothetical protein